MSLEINPQDNHVKNFDQVFKTILSSTRFTILDENLSSSAWISVKHTVAKIIRAVTSCFGAFKPQGTKKPGFDKVVVIERLNGIFETNVENLRTKDTETLWKVHKALERFQKRFTGSDKYIPEQAHDVEKSMPATRDELQFSINIIENVIQEKKANKNNLGNAEEKKNPSSNDQSNESAHGNKETLPPTTSPGLAEVSEHLTQKEEISKEPPPPSQTKVGVQTDPRFAQILGVPDFENGGLLPLDVPLVQSEATKDLTSKEKTTEAPLPTVQPEVDQLDLSSFDMSKAPTFANGGLPLQNIVPEKNGAKNRSFLDSQPLQTPAPSLSQKPKKDQPLSNFQIKTPDSQRPKQLGDLFNHKISLPGEEKEVFSENYHKQKEKNKSDGTMLHRTVSKNVTVTQDNPLKVPTYTPHKSKRVKEKSTTITAHDPQILTNAKGKLKNVR